MLKVATTDPLVACGGLNGCALALAAGLDHWIDIVRHIDIGDFGVEGLDRSDPAEAVENRRCSVRSTAPRSLPVERIDPDLAIAYFHSFSGVPVLVVLVVLVLSLGRSRCGSAVVHCSANSLGCTSLVHVHSLAVVSGHTCHRIGTVVLHFVATVGRRTDCRPS